VELLPARRQETTHATAVVTCGGRVRVGPLTMERLGALDQDADPRAQLTVGPIVGDHLTRT